MQVLMEVCNEVPLLTSLRRKNAIPLFGYRDIILFGDVRQLPPASDGKPFWATHSFTQCFEIFVLKEDRRHERDPLMRDIKEKLAWGGTLPDETFQADKPWPVDEAIWNFIVDGYLRGWGINGSNVSLEDGVALFPRKADVKRWNAACVRQIEEKYGDLCEGINIQGFDPSQTGSKQNRADKVCFAGLQTSDVLQLRTCSPHQMRVMLLHNISPHAGWANGALCRLLSSNSWTGNASPLFKNPDGSFSAKTIFLSNKDQHPEFNVRVSKNGSSSSENQVTSVPVRTDVAQSTQQEWTQVQLTLAYALTGHKAQGLTLPVSYIGLVNIFGFGLPYTLFTRTPFENSIYLVGVPPRDVLFCLLKKDVHGLSAVDSKRIEVESILLNEHSLHSIVDSRLESGQYPQKGERKNSPEYEALVAKVRQEYSSWRNRLNVRQGLKSMTAVSEGFRALEDGVEPWKNREHMWRNLQDVLQQNTETRQRILYYKKVSTQWMTHDTVDVLSMARHGSPCFPVRAAFASSPEMAGRIEGYALNGKSFRRLDFPQAPQDMNWSTSRYVSHARKDKVREVRVFPEADTQNMAEQVDSVSVGAMNGEFADIPCRLCGSSFRFSFSFLRSGMSLLEICFECLFLVEQSTGTDSGVSLASINLPGKRSYSFVAFPTDGRDVS